MNIMNPRLGWALGCIVGLAAVTALPNRVVAAAPAEAATASRPASPPRAPNFDLYPPSVKLSGAADYQSVIAMIRRDDDVTEDATDRVQMRVADPKVARLLQGRLVPVADGTTQLVAEYLGTRRSIDVVVTAAGEHRPVSFHNDVMPVLTRASCNTGSCHGAARGKDGFQLSLFGFDPAGDYHRITREEAARRINLAIPEDSLLLQKAVGSVPHTGGKLMSDNSAYYETLRQWLVQGAKMDSHEGDAAMPTVDSVAIYPPQAVIAGDDSTQQLVVVAHYSDGSTRDVVDLATFSTNNASVASVDSKGLVTPGARGEAFVMARFDTHTVGVQVLTLPEEIRYSPPPTDPSAGYIDQLVMRKLNQLRVEPSPPCGDDEFIRRVTIDIIGLPPTEEQLAAFRVDVAPDKRERLVDSLLMRKEFSEIWAMKLAQLLMIKSGNQFSYKSALLYADWITDQFIAGRPVNELIHELLTSSGGTFTEPSTNFYEIERDPLKTAENVAQVFMGIRTQCAQCHNHPFDRWTMEDYYGFAAFFARVRRKRGEDYREQIIFDVGGGETKHPVTGKPQPPRYLGGDLADPKGGHRRVQMADWLTSADNPYFAPSIANRVWAHFMGVGVVDPVDDIRVSNPASNPELLQTLGDKLVEYDFDLRRLVRDICTSDAYGRSSTPTESNAHDLRNYSHAAVRRIPAESLLDCICAVTESPDKFRGLPRGARAVQIADGATSNYFLTAFGRSPRTTVCEAEASTDPSLSQALHLLNGATVSQKVRGGGVIKRWIETDGLSPEQVVERIYRRCLSRPPSEEESSGLLAGIDASDDNVQSALEDVFWAVLNSREFAFNH